MINFKKKCPSKKTNKHKIKFFGFIVIGTIANTYFLPVMAQEILATNISSNTNNDAPKTDLNINYQNSIAIAASSQLRIDASRDQYRHPVETLAFFGIKPSDKIIEVWPGQGWYSTILAPFLKTGNGQLIAAHFDTTTTNSQLVKDLVENYRVKYTNNNDKYGNVEIVSFGPRSGALGEKNSVDAVLTFRNIHNWMGQGWADKAFSDFFDVLKPGGILGIEEHRADDDGPQDPLAADGYVREDYVIDMALDAGFEFVGSSQINANPKDTKDHPFGVWTLPPVSRTAPQGKPANSYFDQSKYLAIGESDRMTLLFRKPVPPPPIFTAEKINKYNPVKVIFGNQKPKSNTKKSDIDNEEERQKLAAVDVAIKPPITPQPIVPPIKLAEKKEAAVEIKPEVKTEVKPVVEKSEPVPIPVKFDTKDKNLEVKATEIKPPIIDNSPAKTEELPVFTLPNWVDVKNPAPVDAPKIEASKPENKDEKQKKPTSIISNKPAKEVVKPKTIVEKPNNNKDKKPNAIITKEEKPNAKKAITPKTKADVKASNVKANNNSTAKKAATNTDTKDSKKTSGKVVKTVSKAKPETGLKDKASSKTNTKSTAATKKTDVSSTKKTTPKQSTKTNAKPVAKDKSKTNSNIPDWVPPKKKPKT